MISYKLPNQGLPLITHSSQIILTDHSLRVSDVHFEVHEGWKLSLVEVKQFVCRRAAIQIDIWFTPKLMLFALSTISYFKMLTYYLSFQQKY